MADASQPRASTRLARWLVLLLVLVLGGMRWWTGQHGAAPQRSGRPDAAGQGDQAPGIARDDLPNLPVPSSSSVASTSDLTVDCRGRPSSSATSAQVALPGVDVFFITCDAAAGVPVLLREEAHAESVADVKARTSESAAASGL